MQAFNSICKSYGHDFTFVEGAGAAGGLGAGAMFFLNAQLKSGVETFFNLVDIESKIKRDWHYNTDIHNEIAQAIDDTIFMYATRKNINLDLEELDKLIEEIINIALMKY